MELLSLQILLINFIVAVSITAIIYITNKSARKINLILIFIISSFGTFLGGTLAMFFPLNLITHNSLLVKNIIFTIPGILLSLLFIVIWVRGSKSESYF
ncbi:hypothetical protein EW093_00310 [Thiospirochaeta perfilievii]|uniref:Uncharacterized protein n=1 Tax=Thiospirochaeta perfilievii TaxID=252967 RepID=A0A5C1Q758_9SPIO|nr:hypothetical protein [Thiospirochaeta perfilievii]QEN03207.1 hypothetical protein EW093_00310 [Thiospirochaeta perfilievii]